MPPSERHPAVTEHLPQLQQQGEAFLLECLTEVAAMQDMFCVWLVGWLLFVNIKYIKYIHIYVYIIINYSWYFSFFGWGVGF